MGTVPRTPVETRYLLRGMDSLRSRLVRLAQEHSGLGKDLLPLLKEAATDEDTVYIGDGAYVTNERGQIIIYTSNGMHRENEVYVEDVPRLIRALQKLSR